MIKVINLKKIVLFVIIFFIIFLFLYYKNFILGNNIIKNGSNYKLDNILSKMENYKADVDVTITSNKTKNNYVIHQEVNGDYSMQEVIKGEDIEGVKIEKNQNNLKISNTKLNLQKVYENYEDLTSNVMFLNSFVSDYKVEENIPSYCEENNEIILELNMKNNKNTYIKYKKLYVDSKTGKPTKLEIKSNSQKETICIIYTNIEFNK